MWHSIRNIVCACVFTSTCVGGDWQFQQMCSMHWQHDIYFACSIWHVWMLPCILSRCEVIARDVHPRWNHSLLSFLHQYQNVFVTNGKNSKTDTQISSFFFSYLAYFDWLRVQTQKVLFFLVIKLKLGLCIWRGVVGIWIAGLLDDCFCYQSIYPVKHTFDRMHFTLCNTMSNHLFLQFYTSPCSDESSLQIKRSLTWIRLIDEVRKLIFLLYSLSGITGVRSLSTHYKFKNTF